MYPARFCSTIESRLMLEAKLLLAQSDRTANKIKFALSFVTAAIFLS
jgi:hypothetical protein